MPAAIDDGLTKDQRYYRRNREREAARQRADRRANPERHRRNQAAWTRANIEAARAIARKSSARRVERLRAAPTVPFTDDELRARLSMFSGCWICGEEATETDHVKPILAGGPHMLSNIRPICRSCNARKGHRWPLEADSRSIP